MHILIWRYRVPRAAETSFVAHYGPDGSWARLFREGDGYLGTELLRAEGSEGDTASDFVTIDRWASARLQAAFLARFGDAYRRLDEACEALTESEALVGAFEDVP